MACARSGAPAVAGLGLHDPPAFNSFFFLLSLGRRRTPIVLQVPPPHSPRTPAWQDTPKGFLSVHLPEHVLPPHTSRKSPLASKNTPSRKPEGNLGQARSWPPGQGLTRAWTSRGAAPVCTCSAPECGLGPGSGSYCLLLRLCGSSRC